jgi:hypothetical protein
VISCRDKIFWFVSREWQEQLLPSSARLSRVPTAAEINGDFSQTRSGNGAAVTLFDPLTGQPFPGNVIPANRINADGQNILRKFGGFANVSNFNTCRELCIQSPVAGERRVSAA